MSAGVLAATGCRLPAVLREIRRVARGILGSDAYDVYLHHHAVTGCRHEPLSEREFWRRRYDEQGRRPEGRCC